MTAVTNLGKNPVSVVRIWSKVSEIVQGTMIRWNHAAVFAVAFVVVCCAVAVSLWLRDPLAPVIRAAKDVRYRPIEARLAGFPYAARPPLARGERERDLGVSRLQAAALGVAERFGDEAEPRGIHGGGVALLVRGETDAVGKLREATDRAPDEPRYWNDLAAALYTRADAESNPHDLAHALAAVDRALRLDAADVDALFNRALILEALHLRNQAIATWDAYLRVDGTSQWAAEARRRTEALQGATPPSINTAAALQQPHRGDEAKLAPIVDADPELTRRTAETTLLRNWGLAVEKGNAREAEGWLLDARVIGRLLCARTGESLLADAVAAIDRCSSATCRAELAEAHRKYYDVRWRYASQRIVVESASEFRQIAQMFRAHKSPMAFVADYWAVNALEDSSSTAVSQELDLLLASVPGKYAALRAQLWWEVGTNRARTGRPVEALAAYARARDAFVQLGEHLNAARMTTSGAAIQSLLGRPAEAWRQQVTSLGAFSAEGAASDLQTALELAGRTEAIEEHWSEASSLFALAMDPELRRNPRTHVNAMLWRALAVHRQGFSEEAKWQLADARRYAWSIRDESLRQSALDDLTFANAEVIRENDPSRAAAMIDRYLEASKEHQRTFLNADASLARARAARALGRKREAEGFYRSALTTTDTQRRDFLEHGVVEAYFAASVTASAELADLLESESRVGDAFDALEEGRGRGLLEHFARVSRLSADPLTSEEIRTCISERALLVSYLLLRDRTLIFTVSRRDGVRVTRIDTGKATIERLVEELRTSVHRDQQNSADAASDTLYDLLVMPVQSLVNDVETLIIIPDREMETVPFAAFRDSRTGRRLIQDVALVFAPSASVFARTSTRRPTPTKGALVVGNPAFDRTQYPFLEPLRAAEREASDVALGYEHADVIVGTAATSERFLRLMPTAQIIHVAAHAITSRRDPLNSRLLFAPQDRQSGDVRAEDIARSTCAAEIVVLAGCETSLRGETPADIGTLSMAFLASGARNVIGTLWDVDDDDAAAFSRRLHEQIHAGAVPAEAVRRAQIDLLRTRPLRAWCAFTITG